MREKWKSTTAGILCILAGIVFILWGFDTACALTHWSEYLELILPPIIVAIFPIIGGYFAIRRRIWGLTLAGAISPIIFTFLGVFAHGSYEIWGSDFIGLLIVVELLLGILAIIFVSMSKREFS